MNCQPNLKDHTRDKSLLQVFAPFYYMRQIGVEM